MKKEKNSPKNDIPQIPNEILDGGFEHKATAGQKMWYTTKRFFSSPANVILVVFALALAFLIFYPLFTMIVETFMINSPSEGIYDPGKPVGSFTTKWWNRLIVSDYADMYFWTPLGRQVLMAMLASIIAIIYGGVVAFFINRTNI